MAAIVIAPPILLTSTYQRSNFFSINSFVWTIGTDIYQVLDVNLGTTISIIKSSDNGHTWAALDVGNEIAPDGLLYGATLANGIIYFAFPSGSSFQIGSFNTATDLYGTTSSLAGANTKASFTPVVLYRKSDGTLVAIYSSTLGLSYKTLVSGTWASEVTLLTADVGSPTGIVVDSSDRAHLTYIDESSDNLSYLIIAADLTPGSPVLLSSTYDNTETDLRIWNNNIVIAWTETSILNVAIGTHLSAPTFTTQAAITVPGTGQVNYAALSIDTGNKINVFGSWTDYTTTPITDQLLQSVFDGAAWGTPILFYDEVSNPYDNSVSQEDQFIHAVGVPDQLPSNAWVVSLALEAVPPGKLETCAGFALVTAPASLPALACPIASTATIGVPYSSMLLASGGTPPYTFEILS